MPSQQEKFDRFKELHEQERAFVMANPWDAGSARILTAAGFPALATTSAGYAFSVGKRDSFASLSRDEILANAAAIVGATDLPLSADLEDGFGHDPATCADTVSQACDIGLVGGSIEDATGDPAQPILEMSLSVARIAAAAQAVRSKPFLLTARAENFICGRPDLNDTIRRLQAYAQAGADVLYAPGLPDLEAIRRVCAEVGKPVNVLMGLAGPTFTVQELSDAGVARISVGGSFARAASAALLGAAKEVLTFGTFDYAAGAIPDAELAALMDQTKDPTRS